MGLTEAGPLPNKMMQEIQKVVAECRVNLPARMNKEAISGNSLRRIRSYPRAEYGELAELRREMRRSEERHEQERRLDKAEMQKNMRQLEEFYERERRADRSEMQQ